MRAGLPQLEPRLLKRWKEMDLYAKIQQAGKLKSDSFILHDGPPYANGHVHLGTALNKILKDFVVKSQTMMGRRSPYVPGWDCHGMPIEHNVIKDLGQAAGSMSKLEIRKRCRKYAERFLSVQRKEFIRLGCLGDWEHPYITMSRHYEAETLAALGELVAAGYVERGLRPIHWCPTCQTALAEAELEYHEHSSPSIYVKFPLRADEKKIAEFGLNPDQTFVLIWTTTPWTIPANLAIAVHPDFDYSFVRVGQQLLLLASELVETVRQSLGWDAVEVVREIKGRQLEGMRCRHPLYDRDSPVILADYVTLEAGTGCVHTAPGHGAEDFESGRKYGLEILSPVDDAGCFTERVPDLEGRQVFEANDLISDRLREAERLAGSQTISHSYPHCWRCKQPVIFRATEQWFLNVDNNDLRQRALAEIDKVRWIPPWGRLRIYNMVECRPDWCLSRQRAWGVPIPALICKACSHSTITAEVVEQTRALVAERGTDVWYEEPAAMFTPPDFTCPECGGREFEKQEDILDVWFDSSVSQRAVLEHRPELSWPCDMYLEATDQHRGWFQVSLLNAIGTRGAAPYREVLTHGLILDESSKKMSKSLGNVVAPDEVIEKYGADVLRLLLSSVDYTADIAFSRSLLEPVADAYRKIRNTLRFMLGNLSDFDPARALPESDLEQLDRWALARMRERAGRVREAYLNYQFHVIHHLLLDLCTVDLSAFYLDIVKDRLYVAAPGDHTRRAAQSTLYRLALDLLAMLAPVLSFTAEEAWGHLPAEAGRPESVHLAEMPAGAALDGDTELLDRWARLRGVRAEMHKALDVVLKAGQVRSSLDARISIQAEGELREFLESFGQTLPDLLKVADLEFVEKTGDAAFESGDIAGLKIDVLAASDRKCARCWNRRSDVGADAERPDLCARCINVLERLEPQS